MSGKGFDYVIVGAGSAGCVLANRLSARADIRVLLLEAGGRDSSPFIHMPVGIARLVNDPKVDWRFYTDPEPGLYGRSLYWPRGRVLGGSSSINAMCYTRGHPLDYDEWAELAGGQWSYSGVLPDFLKSEDQSQGAGAYHSIGGPLSVEDLKYRNPLTAVFVDAGAACGLPRNADFNAASSGRRRILPGHTTQWTALQHRGCLSRGRARARGESGDTHGLSGDPCAFLGSTRNGGRVSRGRRPARTSLAQSARFCSRRGRSARRGCCCCPGSAPQMSFMPWVFRSLRICPEVGRNQKESPRFLHSEQVHPSDHL